MVLALVLVAWQLTTQSGWVSPVMLPAASDVLAGLWTLVTSEWFAEHAWTTLQTTLAGFGLATVASIVLATVMHMSDLARHVLYPYVIAFKLVPAVVLAPLFVIWFGFGLTPKVLVAASISFFVVVVSTLAGFDSVDREWRELMRLLGASELQTFRILTVRFGLPYLFAGMKAGITLALIGAIVAEFISSRAGLGYLIIQYGRSFQQDMLFASIVVVSVLGLVLFGALSLIQRQVVWWQARNEETMG